MKIFNYFIVLIIVLLMLSSCWRITNYRINKEVADGGWNARDTLVFNIDTVTLSGDYDVSVNIRSSKFYLYQKIWLVIEQSWESPFSDQIDTLAFRLINKGGIPIGEGISINKVDYPLPEIHLIAGQKGSFRIRHLMNDSTLKGIIDIGISLKMNHK